MSVLNGQASTIIPADGISACAGMGLPHEIFADGGVVGKNPSPLGGTWCFLWVSRSGGRLYTEHGLVTPLGAGLPAITNNYTELLAVLKAIQSVPPEWSGTVWTDSMVTFHRFTSSPFGSFKGIPLPLVREVFRLRRECGFQMRHLKGHPSEEELRAGVSRDGLPVSRHNVWCDRACGRVGRSLLEGRRRTAE